MYKNSIPIQLKVIIHERFAPIVPRKTIFPNFHWKKRRITAATENFSNETNLLSILLNSSKMKVGFEIWHISDFTRLIIPLTKVTRIIKSCENFTLEFETFTEVHLSTTIIFDHIKSETNKRKVEIANEEFIIGQ